MRLTAFPIGRFEGSAPVPDHEAISGLLGSWSATRWHHVAVEQPARAIDLVCDLGGTITLSLSLATYVLVWNIPGRETGNVGGPWTSRAGELEFGADPGFRERVEYHLTGGLLTITSESSTWDFENAGEQVPTRFVGVFVKL